MPARMGPRFAIEALFLIALAVGVAYADLATKWIFVVMAGGWLVVALLELTADRIWAAAPPWRRPYYVPASPPRAEAVAATPPPAAVEPEAEAEPEPAAEPEHEREPEPEPEPEPEAVTMIAPRVEPSAGAPPEPEPEAGPDTAEDARPKLEPLEPRRKRGRCRRRER